MRAAACALILLAAAGPASAGTFHALDDTDCTTWDTRGRGVVECVDADGYGRVLRVRSTRDGDAHAASSPLSKIDGARAYVLEATVRARTASAISFHLVETGQVSLVLSGLRVLPDDGSGRALATLVPDTWATIRVETDPAAGLYRVTVDDRPAGSGSFSSPTLADRIRLGDLAPGASGDVEWARIVVRQADATAPAEGGLPDRIVIPWIGVLLGAGLLAPAALLRRR